jgi:hypothetical protein
MTTRNTSGMSCAPSYRALRDGSFEGHFPRHFVPGYDRVVPPGQNVLFKLFSVIQILLLIALRPWFSVGGRDDAKHIQIAGLLSSRRSGTHRHRQRMKR